MWEHLATAVITVPSPDRKQEQELNTTKCGNTTTRHRTYFTLYGQNLESFEVNQERKSRCRGRRWSSHRLAAAACTVTTAARCALFTPNINTDVGGKMVKNQKMHFVSLHMLICIIHKL